MKGPLASFDRNIFSQRGEDGVLEKVFGVIGTKNKFCVEFGAWDGKLNSNTKYLMDNGWQGVFIEADKKRFAELVETYRGNDKATCLNKFVSFTGNDTLDHILKQVGAPASPDLISIDIDGNDYHIWDSLKDFEPRVVIIEFNPTIPADVEFVQKRDTAVTQGASLLSLCKLGKSKGYELVAATQLNGIFVKEENYKLFGIVDNSPMFMKETSLESRIFQLYDGTIAISGNDHLLWHKVDIRPKHIQVIPAIFRTFPDNMNKIQSLLFRIWRKIHNRF